MRTNIYTIATIALLALTTMHTDAQTWRGKHNGLPTGLSPKSVYGEGTRILVTNSTGFSGNQVYYTPDSSTAYNYSASAIGLYATPESHIVKCMNVLFIGSSGGIFKSHDNGKTWSATPTITAAYSIYSIHDTLYAGISILGLKMSVDTGNTWTDVGISGTTVVSIFKSGPTLYAGGTSSLQYTNDGGTTWNSVTAPSSILSAAVTDIAGLGGSVYAGTNNGVYKTSDAGRTWARVLAQSIFGLTAIDTTLLAGTSGSGIYMSDATGTNWNQINSGLPHTGVSSYNTINAIAYNDQLIMCAAGGDSSVYIIGLGELGLHPTMATTATPNKVKDEVAATIYPNPAKDEVTISLNSTAEPTIITLYDVTGHNIRSVSAHNVPSVTMSLSNISAGVYSVGIITGNDQTIKKLVITK